MKTKHWMCIIIAILLVSTGMFVGANTDVVKTLTALVEDFKLFINDEEVELEQPIVTIDGRSFLPVRELSNILNHDVQWDEEKGEIRLYDKTVVEEIPSVNDIITTTYTKNKLFEVNEQYHLFRRLRNNFLIECIRKTDDYFYVVLKDDEGDFSIHLFPYGSERSVTTWYVKNLKDSSAFDTVEVGKTTWMQIWDLDRLGVFQHNDIPEANVELYYYSIHRTLDGKVIRIDYDHKRLPNGRIERFVSEINITDLEDDILYSALLPIDKVDIIERAQAISQIED